MPAPAEQLVGRFRAILYEENSVLGFPVRSNGVPVQARFWKSCKMKGLATRNGQFVPADGVWDGQGRLVPGRRGRRPAKAQAPEAVGGISLVEALVE